MPPGGGIHSINKAFGRIKRSNAQQHLVNDGQAFFRVDLGQIPAPARPTKRQPQHVAALSIWLAQMGIAAIAIDLDRACEAVQYFSDIFAFTSGAL